MSQNIKLTLVSKLKDNIESSIYKINHDYEQKKIIEQLWCDRKFSDKVNSKINYINKLFQNKKIDIEFKFYLNHFKLNNLYYIYYYLKKNQIDNANPDFVINKKKNKLICLFRCKYCCFEIDEDEIIYGPYTIEDNITMITDNICSNCILDDFKISNENKDLFKNKKKALMKIFLKYNYCNKQLSNIFSTIIIENFILGLEKNIF